MKIPDLVVARLPPGPRLSLCREKKGKMRPIKCLYKRLYGYGDSERSHMWEPLLGQRHLAPILQ